MSSKLLSLALVLLAVPEGASLVLRSANPAVVEKKTDLEQVCHPNLEFEISCPVISKMGDESTSLRQKWWLPGTGLIAGAVGMTQKATTQSGAEAKIASNSLLYSMSGSNKLRERFQNKHIVILGDSISQYMYMNLAYNLLHKEPPHFDFTWWKMEEQFKDQSLRIFPRTAENYSKPLSFKQMYTIWEQTSNTQLSTDEAQEVCDCWYENQENMVQNRYLKVGNSAITFLPWHNQNTKFRFHWTPNEGYPIKTECEISDCKPPFKHEIEGDPQGEGLLNVLDEFVMNLQPKPTHILMNKGLWGHMEEPKLRKLFEAGRKMHDIHGTRFIWQTQTQRGYNLGESEEFHRKYPEVPAMNAETDQEIILKEATLAKKYGWEVFDLWEHSKGLEVTRLDDMHYNEHAKTYFNSMLVKQFF